MCKEWDYFAINRIPFRFGRVETLSIYLFGDLRYNHIIRYAIQLQNDIAGCLTDWPEIGRPWTEQFRIRRNGTLICRLWYICYTPIMRSHSVATLRLHGRKRFDIRLMFSKNWSKFIAIAVVYSTLSTGQWYSKSIIPVPNKENACEHEKSKIFRYGRLTSKTFKFKLAL